MQPIITENREAIAELCRAHHVRRLAVFGSAARDDFDPATSDIDLLVEFEIGVRQGREFFALSESLRQLLLREIDLVMGGSIYNPYLLNAISGSEVILYAS